MAHIENRDGLPRLFSHIQPEAAQRQCASLREEGLKPTVNVSDEASRVDQKLPRRRLLPPVLAALRKMIRLGETTSRSGKSDGLLDRSARAGPAGGCAKRQPNRG